MKKLLAEYKTLNLLQKILLWLLVVATLVIVGVAIPLSKSDNVDKYTGGEYRLAVSAMESIRQDQEPLPMTPIYYLKATVEEISMRCVKNEGSQRVYDDTPGCKPGCFVRVTGWTFFGIKSYESIYNTGANLGGVGYCGEK